MSAINEKESSGPGSPDLNPRYLPLNTRILFREFIGLLDADNSIPFRRVASPSYQPGGHTSDGDSEQEGSTKARRYPPPGRECAKPRDSAKAKREHEGADGEDVGRQAELLLEPIALLLNGALHGSDSTASQRAVTSHAGCPRARLVASVASVIGFRTRLHLVSQEPSPR